MKKVWIKPGVESIEVKATMASAWRGKHDAAYNESNEEHNDPHHS